MAQKAFINLPYDSSYEDVFLTYVGVLTLYGLIPTAAIDAPSTKSQFEQILFLLQQCAVSVHDLSWIAVDTKPPYTPRFNMPFELGLAVALERLKKKNHHWVVFDTVPYRLDKALSDTKGMNPHIYDGGALSLFRALTNAFAKRSFEPRQDQFSEVFDALTTESAKLKARGYAVFDAYPFKRLRQVALEVAERVRKV